MNYERIKIDPNGEASEESKQEGLVFEKERKLRKWLEENIEESEKELIETLLNNEVEMLKHSCNFMPEDEFNKKIEEVENKMRDIKPDELKTEQEIVLDGIRKRAPKIVEDYKNNSEENIENLKQELERKKAELKEEEKFYRDNRSNPRKSESDWNALDMSQNTRKKLEEEIRKLEEKILVAK